jgi:hypothetical protein
VTTVAPAPATVDGGCPGLPAPGVDRAGRGPSGAVLRAVPASRAPAPPDVADGRRVTVSAADLAAVLAALRDGPGGHLSQGGHRVVAAAHGRLARALADAERTVPGQVPPGGEQAGGTGTAAVALALVEGLDGNHRRLLLDRLAATCPDVVEAGARWLAEWQATARERRRVSHNRDSKEKRDRRRATGDDKR